MRNKKLALAGVLAMSIVVGTGCSALTPEKTSSPSDSSQGATATQDQGKNTMTTTVYAADANGFVVPLNVRMAATNEVAKATLERMVQGGIGDGLLVGTGLRNILPKDTKIRGLSINNGLAKVDFSKEIMTAGTDREEQAIVDSVVWTLTSLDGVKKVQFLVEGHQQATLKKGTPIANPISRDNGINLQMAQNLSSPSNASKVTLYFTAANETGDFTYLVPVTRMVPKEADQNPINQTLAELAKGPVVKGLQQVIAPTLKPLKAEIKDNVATVDFGDDFKIGETAAGKNMVNSIVLSLAANAGVEQIQFTVNGQAPAAADGVDLTKPVTRPQVINEQKL